MKKRPSWCRAATPRECDHPHGCSACQPPPTDSKAITMQEVARAIKGYEHQWYHGVPEKLGTVRSAVVKEGVLHIEAELTADGLRFVKELEEQGSVPVWFYPTAIGLVSGTLERQASDAVARPASSQQGPSIRVDKTTDQHTRGHAPDSTPRN